jgi:hypothetical protein
LVELGKTPRYGEDGGDRGDGEDRVSVPTDLTVRLSVLRLAIALLLDGAPAEWR